MNEYPTGLPSVTMSCASPSTCTVSRRLQWGIALSAPKFDPLHKGRAKQEINRVTTDAAKRTEDIQLWEAEFHGVVLLWRQDHLEGEVVLHLEAPWVERVVHELQKVLDGALGRQAMVEHVLEADHVAPLCGVEAWKLECGLRWHVGWAIPVTSYSPRGMAANPGVPEARASRPRDGTSSTR